MILGPTQPFINVFLKVEKFAKHAGNYHKPEN
jgi:hypothetical protein